MRTLLKMRDKTIQTSKCQNVLRSNHFMLSADRSLNQFMRIEIRLWFKHYVLSKQKASVEALC